eukprot:snap_masked-scaffold_11-processed-gene-6.16-mRNA-1 protein AED:0.57 eAED:0.58 QI:0/-1/0/1/-1/1/1/0/311
MAYVNLHVLGLVSSGAQEGFTNAAALWNTVLTTPPVNPIPLDSELNLATLCGIPYTYPAGSSIIGLDIFVLLMNLDGAGGILGGGGTCTFTGDIPRIGLMVLDTSDVNNMMKDGLWEVVIKHEMAHVLGVGTSWSKFGLVSGLSTTNPTYNGAFGRSGYESLGGTGNPPVANTGGSGTFGVHWRESTFQNELMTGYVGGGKNPMSIMTVRSLRDLGYSVDESTAEPYTLPKEESKEVGGIELGYDLLDFPYVDMDAVVAENNAKGLVSKQAWEQGVTGAVIGTAFLAFIALVVVMVKKKQQKRTLPAEERV